MVTCKIYFDTGFDSVNIPANISTLERSARKIEKYSPLDILDIWFQTIIKIKAKQGDMYSADYLELSDDKVGRAFYSIISYNSIAADTIALNIVMDSYLTFFSGVPAGYSFLSGSVVRTTAPFDMINKNLLARYQEVDPYFCVSEQPEMRWKGSWFNEKNAESPDSDNLIFYCSSYDEDLQGDLVTSEIAPDIKYNTMAKISNTSTYIRTPFESYNYNQFYEYPGVTIYYGDKILNVAKTLYGLGIDNVIDLSYSVPSVFIQGMEKSGQAVKTLYGKRDKTEILIDSPVIEEYDKYRDDISFLFHKSFASLVLYSPASGNKIEYPLSEIVMNRSADAGGGIITHVYLNVDPSPTGCPFFTPDLIADPMRQPGGTGGLYGALKGASWQNAPVTFSGKGYSKDILSMTNALLMTDMNTTLTKMNMLKNNNADLIANGIKSAGGLLTGAAPSMNYSSGYSDYYSGDRRLGRKWRDNQGYSAQDAFSMSFNPVHAIGTTVNTVTDYASSAYKQGLAYDYYSNIRNLEREKELTQFSIDHMARSIDLKFPVCDSMQNYTGNGVFIAVKKPTYTDFNRFCEIVQKFGIKVPGYVPMDEKFLNRAAGSEPYVYIQANGVEVAGRSGTPIPKNVKNDLSDLFATGVRIWYEKPTDKAYQRMYKKEA